MKPGRTRRVATVCVASVAVVVIAAFVLDRVFPLRLPAPDTLASVVVARDGSPLRAFADSDGVWRYAIARRQVSPLYVDALLAYEDRWFWRHPGVNPWALLRGAAGGLLHGHVVSGGSTLTMQVARSIMPIPHTVGGKLEQIFRALQLEAHLDKAQILDLYLNHAPFGGPIEGVEAASWAYLGKPAAQLSHAEAALLAILPQSPSRLRPDRHPAAARVARDKLIRRMHDLGVWDAAEAEDAMTETVTARSMHAPLEAALLAERLHAAAPDQRRIVTTIDASLQRAVEDRIGSYLSRLPTRSSVAVLVVDNATREARVYVGTAAFANAERLGHVDMVRAQRSPGSTLKPFLYGLAMDDGLIGSASLLVDGPEDFEGYRPGNFDETFRGPVSVADALQSSLNVPAVDILDRVGATRFVARLAAGGLDLKLPGGATPNLSVILGGTSTRLEDLVGAYTAFANGGVAGKVRYTPDDPLQERRILSPGAAWIVRDILATNPADVVGAAIPGAASARRPLAWKTGTSYGYRDAWAIGVDDDWTIGVWIGRPDGTPSPGQYGAVTSLPLLFAIDEMLPVTGTGHHAPRPGSVAEADICWPLGGRSVNTVTSNCRQHRHGWILDGVVPPTFAERGTTAWAAGLVTMRVDARGRRLSGSCQPSVTETKQLARWPALAMPWLSSDDIAAGSLPPLAPGCAPDSLDAAGPIRIAGLANDTTLRQATNATRPLRVTLNAVGTTQTVNWLLDGRWISASVGVAPVKIELTTAGRHQVTAVASDGPFSRITLTVVPPAM